MRLLRILSVNKMKVEQIICSAFLSCTGGVNLFGWQKEVSMLVQLQKITKNYGMEPLFEALNLQINEGEKIGLIGSNGSGKSTILKIIKGLETVDAGTVSSKKNGQIGYLAQTPNVSEQQVKMYLLETFTRLHVIQEQMTRLEQQMTNLEGDLESSLAKYGQKQAEFQQAGGYEIENKLERIANGLKIDHLLMKKCSELSGGEQAIIDLARILLQENELILLDEPTNHLDAERMIWLESYLFRQKTACMLVSHDRLFLDHVVTKIFEIEEGQLSEYQGNYSFYKKQKEKELEKISHDFSEQQKEIKKVTLAIRRFRQWGHEGDNEKFFKKAKQLEKRLEKIQKIPKPKDENPKLAKHFNESERSSKRIVHFEKVSKYYGDQKLFNEAEFSLFWQDHVAIVGANGAGKSTLLKLMLGLEQPDTGQVIQGANLQIGYLSQTIEYESPKQTILQNFRRECAEDEQNCRRILANFSFYTEDVIKQVRFLSGGEKIRLELAKLMYNKVNLLILDEPTNHLDIETREEIEEILQLFKGTLIVVSHDRFFLQKLFDTFLVVKNQHVTKMKGSYLDILSVNDELLK